MNSTEKGEKTRERILKTITDYIKEHQYPPTFREICEISGIGSTATVNHHILKLIKSGELETNHGNGASRALRVPSIAAEIDALYLAKCQEVNELNGQICRLTEEIERLKEESKHGLGRESIETA